jgi:hypothetical protein
VEGGALWTLAYTPGDGQTSWVNSDNPVLHQHWFIYSYIAAYIQVQYRVIGVHPTGLTVARGVSRCLQTIVRKYNG